MTLDATIERIAAYAHALRFESLTQKAVHETKRRVIDTLGCALGGYDNEPCRIARTLAARAETEDGARILGTSHRTLPELATFANGVMARYLDGNDTFPGGGGHPSDTISPVLAVAESQRADGKALITAIALAYEVYYAFFRGAIMRERGMDHVLYTAVASAAGAAKLLGLNERKLAQAVSLAVTPNIALHATRRGDLSMWKGVAAGNASRNGVFAAMLSDAIFCEERIRDPKVHALADKVSVKEDPEFTKRFPPATPCRLEVRTRRGEVKTAAVEYPRGHFKNPMSDEEVELKFRALAGRLLPAARVDNALKRLWNIDREAQAAVALDVTAGP